MLVPMDVNKWKWIREHLYMCGTCKLYRKGICNNLANETYGNYVGDEDSCDAYVPERKVMYEIEQAEKNTRRTDRKI